MPKTCTRCKIPKEKSSFSSSSATKDGLQRWCNQCFNIYRQDRRGVTIPCEIIDKDAGIVKLWGKIWKLRPVKKRDE